MAIARAFVEDSEILILDEATSNVDTRTEKEIQDAMQRVMRSRTSLVIAHRLSTIRDSDLIIVMDHGKIVESGNHMSLLKQKGKYYELYMTQYAGFATYLHLGKVALYRMSYARTRNEINDTTFFGFVK